MFHLPYDKPQASRRSMLSVDYPRLGACGPLPGGRGGAGLGLSRITQVVQNAMVQKYQAQVTVTVGKLRHRHARTTVRPPRVRRPRYGHGCVNVTPSAGGRDCVRCAGPTTVPLYSRSRQPEQAGERNQDSPAPHHFSICQWPGPDRALNRYQPAAPSPGITQLLQST